MKGRLLGQNQNVGKYTVADEDGSEYEMIYFGDIQAFHEYLDQKFESRRLRGCIREEDVRLCCL